MKWLSQLTGSVLIGTLTLTAIESAKAVDGKEEFAKIGKIFTSAQAAISADVTGVYIGYCYNQYKFQHESAVFAGFYGDPKKHEESVFRVTLGSADGYQELGNMNMENAASFIAKQWSESEQFGLEQASVKNGSLTSVLRNDEDNEFQIRTKGDVVVGAMMSGGGSRPKGYIYRYCLFEKQVWPVTQ